METYIREAGRQEEEKRLGQRKDKQIRKKGREEEIGGEERHS